MECGITSIIGPMSNSFTKELPSWIKNNFHRVSYTKQVAKFTLDDFDHFFNENGLDIVSVYGDYDLNEYNAQSSKRMIITARKNK